MLKRISGLFVVLTLTASIVLTTALFGLTVEASSTSFQSDTIRTTDRLLDTRQQSALNNSQSALNQTVRQIARQAQGSQVSQLVTGRTVNVHVTLPNGSTKVVGVKFDQTGQISNTKSGGFSNPELSVRTTETTLQSIVSSNASVTATRKALTYELLKIEGTDTGTKLAAGAGSEVASRLTNRQTTAVKVDLDNDTEHDAILEIEGVDTDDDGTYEKQINTVLRDADGDGTLETISSDLVDVNPSITGVARIDTNDDNQEDTILRIQGFDLNEDGKFEKLTKTKFANTTGDKGLDTFSETTTSVQSTNKLSTEWDLNNDGTPDVKVVVDGKDTNGDGRFDKKTTTVHLNIDGEAGYDTSSSTTSKTVPTLSMSVEFDTTGDGTPDTKVGVTAIDSNNDGVMDSRSTEIVKDTDGDGKYDQTLALVKCRRGVFRKSVCHDQYVGSKSELVEFLAAPETLSRLGALASIIGTLVSLYRGE